ncbi:MAG: desulfoferrodoxin [Candidatus Falkowbacteria bacterium]|nr:desulfoferrodoxin [Candidatus Falkowbacteria bacterium]
MSDRVKRIYFCRHCGSELEFLKDGGGHIFCCGEEMIIKKPGSNSEE